jgi:hypothetical protein
LVIKKVGAKRVRAFFCVKKGVDESKMFKWEIPITPKTLKIQKGHWQSFFSLFFPEAGWSGTAQFMAGKVIFLPALVRLSSEGLPWDKNGWQSASTTLSRKGARITVITIKQAKNFLYEFFLAIIGEYVKSQN